MATKQANVGAGYWASLRPARIGESDRPALAAALPIPDDPEAAEAVNLAGSHLVPAIRMASSREARPGPALRADRLPGLRAHRRRAATDTKAMRKRKPPLSSAPRGGEDQLDHLPPLGPHLLQLARLVLALPIELVGEVE